MRTRPLDVAKEYAEGKITRQECVDILATWKYTPRIVAPPDVYADMSFPGSMIDLSIATRQKLIDYEMYDKILDKMLSTQQ